MNQLGKLGFGGLWRSCSMGSMDDVNRHCFELTERLIEVSGPCHCCMWLETLTTIFWLSLCS